MRHIRKAAGLESPLETLVAHTTFKIDKIMPGPVSPCPLGENSKSKGAILIPPRFRVYAIILYIPKLIFFFQRC